MMKTAEQIIRAAQQLDIGEYFQSIIEEAAKSAEEDGDVPSDRVFNALEYEIECARKAQGVCR
jgi:hypothetical protein